MASRLSPASSPVRCASVAVDWQPTVRPRRKPVQRRRWASSARCCTQRRAGPPSCSDPPANFASAPSSHEALAGRLRVLALGVHDSFDARNQRSGSAQELTAAKSVSPDVGHAAERGLDKLSAPSRLRRGRRSALLRNAAPVHRRDARSGRSAELPDCFDDQGKRCSMCPAAQRARDTPDLEPDVLTWMGSTRSASPARRRDARAPL